MCSTLTLSSPYCSVLQVFLWPIAGILIAVPVAILMGFNPARFTLGIYFS